MSRQRKGREDSYTLARQERLMREWAEREGHELVAVERDVASGKNARRPGLKRALAALDDGAEVLVVGKLDRLSRSVIDFAKLVERSTQEGWSLAVLDIGVDTATPNGELVAGILVQVAQWERRIIGQRTREILAEAKLDGVRVGRPASVPPDVVRRVRRRRRSGWTLQRIADTLEREGVPTGQGGKRWRPSSVAAVLRRHAA